MTDIDVKLDEKIKVNYKEPKKYKVIFTVSSLILE